MNNGLARLSIIVPHKIETKVNRYHSYKIKVFSLRVYQEENILTDNYIPHNYFIELSLVYFSALRWIKDLSNKKI
jgi:hypothetical protein